MPDSPVVSALREVVRRVVPDAVETRLWGSVSFHRPATGGRVIAHLVRANEAPEAGTGWHTHQADFHIVIMLKGWAKFMYEDKETLVEAGDCIHQRPGIVHYLYDYSPDMEYLEVVGPADFGTQDAEGPCAVPKPVPWPEGAAPG